MDGGTTNKSVTLSSKSTSGTAMHPEQLAGSLGGAPGDAGASTSGSASDVKQSVDKGKEKADVREEEFERAFSERLNQLPKIPNKTPRKKKISAQQKVKQLKNKKRNTKRKHDNALKTVADQIRDLEAKTKAADDVIRELQQSKIDAAADAVEEERCCADLIGHEFRFHTPRAVSSKLYQILACLSTVPFIIMLLILIFRSIFMEDTSVITDSCIVVLLFTFFLFIFLAWAGLLFHYLEHNKKFIINWNTFTYSISDLYDYHSFEIVTDLETNPLDMRTDMGATVDLKHADARLATCNYTSNAPWVDNIGITRQSRDQVLVISLEMLSQIAVLKRSSISMSPVVAGTRLEMAASTYFAANISRFRDVTDDVTQSTLLVAYGLHRSRAEKFLCVPFSSSLLA